MTGYIEDGPGWYDQGYGGSWQEFPRFAPFGLDLKQALCED